MAPGCIMGKRQASGSQGDAPGNAVLESPIHKVGRNFQVTQCQITRHIL